MNDLFDAPESDQEEAQHAIDTKANSEAIEAESVESEIQELSSKPKSEVVTFEAKDISKIDSLDEMRNTISVVLRGYEDGREPVKGVRRIDDVWNQVWKVEDTNQTLLMCMNQTVVLFNKAYDEFLTFSKQDEEYLKRLQEDAVACSDKEDDKSKETKRLCKTERERIEKKGMFAQKNLRGFMDCITKMSHEYRQCRTSAAYFVHIAQVEQFKCMILASIHQQIHDQGVLQKISDSISNAGLKLFPVETTQNDR